VKILLISYYFPPYNAVGAVRPGKLAKFLHRRGHEVKVVSAGGQPFAAGLPLEIPAERVAYAGGWSVNAPVQMLLGGREKVAREGYMTGRAASPWPQRLGRWYKMLLHWPDAEIGWVAAARVAGRRLLAAGGYDLIYVSAPPFSGLRVGAQLSREFGVPWVAEFRDLWSDNHNYAHPSWRRAIERRWEARLLRTASALVTVSAPLARTLSRFGKPVWEIRNGYDAEDLVGLDAAATGPRDRLEIAYTGSVYPAYHDLAGFCEGLALFRNAGGQARVRVAGRNVAPLLAAARQCNVDDWFEAQATVERREALAMQLSADVLLMFLWCDGEDGIYTTKLFEYAGARRPILAVGPHSGDVGKLITDARIGAVGASAKEVAALLRGWQYSKTSQGRLEVVPMPHNDFSRESQFARLEQRLLQLWLSGQ
jgi:glycosyltransferase involved in cell wall biosynthesis